MRRLLEGGSDETDDRMRHVRLLQRGNLVAESFTFTDARASSRWCSLVAPTIGAVMTGLASNHATARADYRLSIVPSNRGPV
jgi:hypothetical protein